MAILHPFRAVRPSAGSVQDVACVPYDVINTAEARALAHGNPASFLHVIRPEIDLDPGISEYDAVVYETGARNLRAFVEGSTSIQESEPSLYLYRLIMDGRSQTGVFGCVAVSDYDSDVILKHEKTRPSKEDDRTKHIVAQKAHAEPVMLTFRDSTAVESIMASTVSHTPLYDFVAADGIQHTVWKVAATDELVSAFKSIEHLYVADGHHRCKAASRAADEIGGDADSEVMFFPAVLFPMGEMSIMAYNRIIKTLPMSKQDMIDLLKTRFGAKPGSAEPGEPGFVSALVEKEWYRFKLPESNLTDSASSLDVARLGEFFLEPVLGIADPRTDSNIDFVGGIRGTDELERLVQNGTASMALSMHPTSVQQLIDVSDDGLLMPPKSTWFEPKLRSGLLVHLF
jgi:uncharacterized protein (DUF1015 family)